VATARSEKEGRGGENGRWLEICVAASRWRGSGRVGWCRSDHGLHDEAVNWETPVSSRNLFGRPTCSFVGRSQWQEAHYAAEDGFCAVSIDVNGRRRSGVSGRRVDNGAEVRVSPGRTMELSSREHRELFARGLGQQVW